MRAEFIKYIQNESFPCIMAKAVSRNGNLALHFVKDIELKKTVQKVQKKVYTFVDDYRRYPEKLHSFVLIFDKKEYLDFSYFEKVFWEFLTKLHKSDKKLHPYDSRVSSDPKSDNFSYSLKSESFFILILHPKSPRWSRRFKYPAIVFNPHQQFEGLRKRGIFKKIRDLIRKKDQLLQGSTNPMLNDFGDKSEVFQYTGKLYTPGENLPLFH